MSLIVNFSLDVTKLPKEKMIKGKKGTYVNLTAFIGDFDKFGNNAALAVSMTKEEREAGESRVYVGNGKIASLNTEPLEVAGKSGGTQAAEISSDESNDLPF
jgi:hypothetical protein